MTGQLEKQGNGAKAATPHHSDPFNVFRSEMNRLIDNFTGGGFPDFRNLFSGGAERSGFPDIDVSENDTGLLIEAELPGIDEKDISVTMKNGMLTIKGEKKFEHEEEKENFHRIERRYGSFLRTLSVPDTVDEDQIEAKFEKGVLSVKLPKRPDAELEVRKIAVKSA